MRKIIAFISPVFEYAVKYSPLTFLFMFMLFHFSTNSLLLFLSGLLFAFAISVTVSLIHDVRSAMELQGFLKEYSNYVFRPISLDEVFDENELTELKCMLRIYKDNLVDCYEPIIKDRIISKRFFGFRAFPNNLGVSTVFISSTTEDMSLEYKFKLFHELGHLSKGHYEVITLHDSTFINYMVFLFLVSISVIGYPFITLLAFACTIVYSINIALLSNYSIKRIESIADIFGVSMIRDEDDRKKLITYLEEKRIVDPEIMSYCDWWIKDYINTEKMNKPFLKLGTKRFKHLLRKTLSDRSVNYYSLIEKFSTPSLVVVFILFGSIISTSIFASGSISMMATLSLFIVLLLPIPIMLYLLFALIFFNKLNNHFLKK
jgi:Zn-dependent protease with chaperone function